MAFISFTVSLGYIFARFGLMASVAYIPLCFFAMFGFCQIVGSIQNCHSRSVSMTFTTIIIWAILFAVGYFVTVNLLAIKLIIYYIALAIGFVMSITSGHIQ